MVALVVRDAGGVQDWYVTCIEGIAGGTIPPLPSGVRTTDGHREPHHNIANQAARFSNHTINSYLD